MDADDARLDRERQLDLLGHTERLVSSGTWSWTPDTGELVWSDNLFRLFGLEPGAIEPSIERLLGYAHPEDREYLDGVLRALPTGEAPAIYDHRIVREDGLVRYLRVALASVDARAGRPPRLVGVARDRTQERRLEDKLRAHAAVSEALDAWREIEDGAPRVLKGLGTALDLPFGAFWVAGGSGMRPAAVWHEPRPGLDHLAATTADWRPGWGAAGVGRAWALRRPMVVDSPAEAAPALRRTAMRAAGIQAAVVVPAVSPAETLAVMELLSPHPVEATDRLLRVLTGIGHEVGHFLAHRRGQLDAPVLSPREVEVLQLAAAGVPAAEIAARLGLSRATVKRHFEAAYARLGAPDRAAAVAEAMRRGLIT